MRSVRDTIFAVEKQKILEYVCVCVFVCVCVCIIASVIGKGSRIFSALL
jgi:hypothetical protein